MNPVKWAEEISEKSQKGQTFGALVCLEFR